MTEMNNGSDWKMWLDLVCLLFFYAFFFWIAVEDLKHKTVKRWHLTVLLLLGASCCLINHTVMKLIAEGVALLFLVLWLVIKKLKKAIGAADVLAIFALSLALPGEIFFAGLVLSGVLAAAFALIKIVKKKQDTLPFLPFLWVGTLLCEIGGMILENL